MRRLHKLGAFRIGTAYKDGIITDILKGHGLTAKLIVAYPKKEKEIRIHRVTRHKWEEI